MHGTAKLWAHFLKRWAPKAPTLFRKLGIMAKVQDEMGHGELLLCVAEHLLKPYGKKRDDLMQDLFAGDLKFHNVFHMEKIWGMQADWLVSRRGWRLSPKRICWASSVDMPVHYNEFVQKRFFMLNTEKQSLWLWLRVRLNRDKRCKTLLIIGGKLCYFSSDRQERMKWVLRNKILP